MEFKKICFNCMKEKAQEGGFCQYCGFCNEEYSVQPGQLPPLTPLNGKYLLGKVLGSGGFGITYIALDLHLQLVVAIKELCLKNICSREENKTISVKTQDFICFEENKKRFLQEARVLAMFNEQENEGVVIVRDHFEENNTAYIVMEYLDGKTLKSIAGGSALSFEETKELLEPVCHALMKIHEFKIMHLDVSPDNIMIQEGKRARLLDFGGAKTIGEKEEHDIVSFKRGYAPPEQYMENGRIGPWTDIYAVAATMYYCMTGRKPIDAMERKAGAELKRFSAMGIKIPAEAEDAIFKALELNPDDRFQSMEAFWNAIDVKKKSASKHSQKKGRVKPALVVCAVLLVAAAAAAAFVVSSQNKNTQESSSATAVSDISSQTVEEEEYAVGETMPMTLAAYMFENVEYSSYVMGVDSGFGDDGTSLKLVAYEEANKNRFFLTDEDTTDGFYNLRAAHTNSFIETESSQEIGETMRQFSKLYDSGTEKWAFVYCGHDEETDLDMVIIRNAAGSVLAPKDGENSEIILKEYDITDDSQKWLLRWTQKDDSEKAVIVHQEGDLVEDIEGIFSISSALDGKTSMCMNSDSAYHEEPTVVVFYADWLTAEDTLFQFEFVPAGSQSRYKIYPVEQESEKKQCLEYDPESKEIVMREESDSNNQLFRIVYVKSNVYLIQTYDESVIGFDLDENGEAVGTAVLARDYESVEDSRLKSWLFNEVESEE